ncbi:MAG: hypothetical protein OK474_00560 [Thaumarchaeota archaeon]|nr:hypothetical protein [Nitrososphaerota archaeon]
MVGSVPSTTTHGPARDIGHPRRQTAAPSDEEGTSQPTPAPPVSGAEPSDRKPRARGYRRKSNIVWAVAVALVALLAIYAFGGFGSSPGPTYDQTTSTTYSISATAVIQAAVQQGPAGYTATTLRAVNSSHPGAQSAAYAILNESQSLANMTVIVFGTTNSSQSYYDLFASHVVGLPGYTNITPVLNGYEQYGKCYGYGEDVDGIAVANGICTDGNVFLQAHLSSTAPFSQLEADLSSLMGSMYQSLD